MVFVVCFFFFFGFVVMAVVHRVVVLVWNLAPEGKREPETGLKATGRSRAHTPSIWMSPEGAGYGHGLPSGGSCIFLFPVFEGS